MLYFPAIYFLHFFLPEQCTKFFSGDSLAALWPVPPNCQHLEIISSAVHPGCSFEGKEQSDAGTSTGKPLALYFFNPMQPHSCSGIPTWKIMKSCQTNWSHSSRITVGVGDEAYVFDVPAGFPLYFYLSD